MGEPRRCGTADRTSVSSRHRLELRGDKVWLVEAGRLEVFVNMATESERSGRRYHMCQAGPGGAIVGLDTDEMFLDAVVDDSVRLRTVDWQAFVANLAEPHGDGAYQHAVERWWSSSPVSSPTGVRGRARSPPG